MRRFVALLVLFFTGSALAVPLPGRAPGSTPPKTRRLPTTWDFTLADGRTAVVDTHLRLTIGGRVAPPGRYPVARTNNVLVTNENIEAVLDPRGRSLSAGPVDFAALGEWVGIAPLPSP